MLYRKRLAGRIYEVFGSGVFKSTDGAGSWTAAHSGLITDSHVWTLAIGPTNPTTLRGSRTLACPLGACRTFGVSPLFSTTVIF